MSKNSGSKLNGESKKALKKKAERLFKKLIQAKTKLEQLESEMAALIQPFVDLKQLNVSYQPSDGFIVNDAYENNAPLTDCLDAILDKGRLSIDNYKDLSV